MTGQRVGDLQLPDGTLLISVLRGSEGLIPNADTVLEPGDGILAVLDPKIEDEVTAYFVSPPSTSGESGKSTSCSLGVGWRRPTARPS